jgi:hypothetical protein
MEMATSPAAERCATGGFSTPARPHFGSAFWWNGQPRQFRDLLEGVSKLRVGDPMDESTDLVR